MSQRSGRRQALGELQCTRPDVQKANIASFLEEQKENRPGGLMGKNNVLKEGKVIGATAHQRKPVLLGQCTKCAAKDAEIKRLEEKTAENCRLRQRIGLLEAQVEQLEARAVQGELLANDFSVAYEELETKYKAEKRTESYDDLVDRLFSLDDEVLALREQVAELQREANYHKHLHIVYRAQAEAVQEDREGAIMD